MSNQLEWEACRYVLEDPTLDRQAFELRMLDDVELALAVARAMSDVELLRAASHRISPADQPLTSQAQAAVQSSVHATTTSSADIGWHWTSLAALAATLLLAVGMAGYSLRQFARTSASSSIASHQQSLAESWLAIRHTELVDPSTNLSSDHPDTDLSALSRDEATSDSSDLTSTPASPASADDSGDWLIDAAREFYAQGVAG